MSMMWAVVKDTPQDTVWRQVPVPAYGPADVLIQVRAAALCGTDLHLYDWNAWAQGAGVVLPQILGHECSGEIAAIGNQVTGLAVGDKVAVETHIPCGVCRLCQDGQPHICQNLRLFGVHTPGCFAPYAVVPAVCARRLPADLPYDIGAVMEPLGTAFRAALTAQAGGAAVAVSGCGPIGLFAVAAARYLGASCVMAIDVSATRLALAKQLGADITINPAQTAVTPAVRSVTGGYGADAIIEASGNAAAVAGTFDFLRKGGRLVLVGLPDRPVSLDVGPQVVFKEAKIIGIHGRHMFATWTALENALASGRLAVEPVLTHRLPLARWQEGIDAAKSGVACKVIYHP